MTKFYLKILTLVVPIFFISLENFAGLGNGFHPDSSHYLEQSSLVVAEIMASDNWYLNILNNFYYFIVFFLKSDVFIIIALNYFSFVTTNFLILNSLKRCSLPLVLLLFAPYRLHLVGHVLKDTLIIFFTITPFIFSSVFSKISVFFNLIFRVISISYYLVAIPRRHILFILFSFFLLLLIPSVNDFLLSRTDIEMGGREFDNLPTFSSYANGYLIRSLLWPLLLIFGFFFFMSPSISFFPLFIEFFLFTVNNRRQLVHVLVISFLIASVVTTYTSFLRYIYPVVITLIYKNEKSRNYRY